MTNKTTPTPKAAPKAEAPKTEEVKGEDKKVIEFVFPKLADDNIELIIRANVVRYASITQTLHCVPATKQTGVDVNMVRKALNTAGEIRNVEIVCAAKTLAYIREDKNGKLDEDGKPDYSIYVENNGKTTEFTNAVWEDAVMQVLIRIPELAEAQKKRAAKEALEAKQAKLKALQAEIEALSKAAA